MQTMSYFTSHKPIQGHRSCIFNRNSKIWGFLQRRTTPIQCAHKWINSQDSIKLFCLDAYKFSCQKSGKSDRWMVSGRTGRVEDGPKQWRENLTLHSADFGGRSTTNINLHIKSHFRIEFCFSITSIMLIFDKHNQFSISNRLWM